MNIEKRKIYVANLSGGKDSLFMLKIILSNPQKYPLHYVVHFDIGINNIIECNVWNYICRILDNYNIKHITIKPEKTYEELITKNDIATKRVRWCNSQLKMNCVKQLERWVNSQGGEVIHYIGYCADENRRFKDNKNHIYPLVLENIYENDILQAVKYNPIFGGWYKSFNRLGCRFCPCGTYKEWAWEYIYNREDFEKQFELVRDYERKYNTTYFQSNPKYNADYVYNIIIKKYVPMILKEQEND